MYLDERLEFCDATVVTGMGGATTLIGDVIDLGSVARDIGQGQPMYWVVQVAVVITGGTSNRWILASDSAEAINTGGTASQHVVTDIYAVADLVAGFQIIFPLPMGDVAASVAPYEQYLGVLNVDVGTQTAGSINSFLTADPHGWRAYPDANN